MTIAVISILIPTAFSLDVSSGSAALAKDFVRADLLQISRGCAVI